MDIVKFIDGVYEETKVNLDYACLSGSFDIIKALYESNASENYNDILTYNEFLPIHYLCKSTKHYLRVSDETKFVEIFQYLQSTKSFILNETFTGETQLSLSLSNEHHFETPSKIITYKTFSTKVDLSDTIVFPNKFQKEEIIGSNLYKKLEEVVTNINTADCDTSN